MREIKLLAWDGKRMGQVAVWNLGNLVSLVGSANDFFIAKAVVQYIGLKDKNDIEIYTGWIVETEGHRFVIEFSTSYNSAYYAGYRTDDRNLETEMQLFDYGELEVIGNIYENPELLDG